MKHKISMTVIDVYPEEWLLEDFPNYGTDEFNPEEADQKVQQYWEGTLKYMYPCLDVVKVQVERVNEEES